MQKRPAELHDREQKCCGPCICTSRLRLFGGKRCKSRVCPQLVAAASPTHVVHVTLGRTLVYAPIVCSPGWSRLLRGVRIRAFRDTQGILIAMLRTIIYATVIRALGRRIDDGASRVQVERWCRQCVAIGSPTTKRYDNKDRDY